MSFPFAFKKNLEYIPIALVVLFFMAEEDLEHHIFSSCFQMVISLFVILGFLMLVRKLKCDRKIAILILAVFWIFLVYGKQCYLRKFKLNTNGQTD